MSNPLRNSRPTFEERNVRGNVGPIRRRVDKVFEKELAKIWQQHAYSVSSHRRSYDNYEES